MSDTVYMNAVITPHRSLSRRGFQRLIGVVVAFNLASATLMVALHAFPVPIFLGLDVLAVLIAFRASYGGARQAERVRVTAEAVEVLHEAGRLSRTVWRSPTAFTQVAVEAPTTHETRVSLRLSGKTVVVGHALSPGERAAFGEALERAIRKARAERL
jgi:uncharacterized membrane protein